MEVYELFLQFGDDLRLVGVFSKKENMRPWIKSVLKYECILDYEPRSIDRLADDLMEQGSINLRHAHVLFWQRAEVDKAYDVYGGPMREYEDGHQRIHTV